MNIWNGLTSSRATLDNTRSPDHADYLRIVNEIQQLQNFVVSLSQNITIMPNLEEELQKAYTHIIGLQDQISKLEPPDDLRKDFVILVKQLQEIDSRKSIFKLQQEMESLKNIVASNQLQVLQLQAKFAEDVKGFQNRIWTTLNNLQKDVINRLVILEKRVESLSLHVDVAKILGQLNEQNRQ